MENLHIQIEPVTNEIAGIIRGAPMSFDLADRGSVNPLFEPYTATADNCQTCVAVFKARLDGFDVYAKPFDISNKIMDSLSMNTSLAWIDKVTGTFPLYIKPKETYIPRLLKWFDDNLIDDNYYTIEFYRKGTSDGHIMIIFKKEDNFILYDPQSNDLLKENDLISFLYIIRKRTIKLINISNCFLNKPVLDCIVEAAK